MIIDVIYLLSSQNNNNMPLKTTATMLLDTPDSRVNRKIDWSTTIDYQTWTAEMKLDSPWKMITVNGDLQNTDNMKAMNLVAMIDGDKEYALRFTMPVTEKKNGFEFQPQLDITWHGIPSPRIVGTLLFISNRKIDFSLRLRNIFSEPAKATGQYDNDALVSPSFV